MDKSVLEQYQARTLLNKTLEDVLKEHRKRTKDFDSLAIRKYTRTIERVIEGNKAILQEILEAIGNIEDPLYRRILYSKYVEAKCLEDIAEENHYSYGHLSRLTKVALKQLKNYN